MNQDDSDNDEGFVPTKVEIDPEKKATPLKQDNKAQRPLDFQARYIFGDGIFRKEPSEMYTRFSKCLNTPVDESSGPLIWSKQEPSHPFETYIAGADYSLVYSRFKDRVTITRDSDDFTDNQISLAKVLNSYNADNFSILKAFEFSNNNESHKCKELEFDSRFQGGNLQYAFKNNNLPNTYSLFLQNDTNSYGYNQWFYFSLKNAIPGVPYRFSIMNLKKKSSFFSKGMKISVFSLLDAQKNQGCGWRKMGTNMKYEKSTIRKREDKKFKFYSLSFEVTFLHANDYVCLAMNIPYSYSRLMHNLRICESLAQQQEDRQWSLEPISYSICNNAVPYVTISSKNQQSKKMVIIMARQHPGETWSSFLMEQILYSLSQSKSESINWLLENYTFKIFPMINVDGVIYGNFRCDIGGFDLNRNWKNPKKNLHPQVSSIKEEIEKLIAQGYEVQCVLDLHGHSKQYNTFCYSCKNDAVKCRILPNIISSLTDIFSFKDCTFGISKYKQTTARATIYSIIQNQNVLTIENSFFGYKDSNSKVSVYDPSVMGDLAEAIMDGLQIFLNKSEKYLQFEKIVKDNIAEYLSYEKKGVIDSGSESDPYGDEISIKEKIKKILPKSFINIEEQLELEQQRKNISKKKVIKKKKQEIKNFETIAIETKKPKKPKKKKNDDDEMFKTFIEKSSLIQYKRNSKELSQNKRRNDNNTILSAASEDVQRQSIDISQDDYRKTNKFSSTLQSKNNDELPFFIRDKPKLVPIKLKNDSFQIFKDAYNATKQKEEGSNKKIQNKINLRRPKVEESEKEQFPLLCVFSEKKKKAELDRQRVESERKARESEQPVKQKKVVAYQYQRLDTIKKTTREKSLQDKSKANAALISKVWRENFTRYGKDLGVFFGGIYNK